MGKIFDLTEKQSELAARLMWADEPEEIAKIEKEISALNYSKEDYIAWLSDVYVELVGVAEARKKRADAMDKQAKVAANAAKRQKDRILEAFKQLNIKNVETKYINWTLSKGKEVPFIDENVDFLQWPDFLVETVVTTETIPDKKGALKFMQEGHVLPGAYIVRNPYLIGK